MWVLLKAYCILCNLTKPIFSVKIPEADLYVRLGITSLDSADYLERQISQSIPFEGYNQDSKEADIGLLKMAKRVHFQWNISPVRLDNGKEG